MRTKQTARKATVPVVMDFGTKKQKALVKGPMQPEVKHLDYKCSEKGTWYYAETKEDKEIPDQVNWWDMYVLCIVRQFNGKISSQVSLKINSPHLKSILKDVIGTFPGISFETKNITIPQPYRVLYHYYNELSAQAATLDKESEAANHLEVLLEFVRETFEDTFSESENLREQRLMSFAHLWTLFRPGTTVYASLLGQPRSCELLGYSYNYGEEPHLALETRFVDFDGDNFGTRDKTMAIRAFAGAVEIDFLPVYPIQYHEDEARLRSRLIARGKRFEGMAGTHFYHYTGIALEQTRCGLSRYSHDGRIVIDTKTFHRINANLAFSVEAKVPKSENDEPKAKRRRLNHHKGGDDDDEVADLVPHERKLEPLSDEECLMTNAVVRGFSFAEKRWFDFFVDDLTEIEWNPDCFDQLVLPEAQKDTVKALVSTHVQNKLGFDDIVKGKGQGLILVLHGPPGVGKTLTAETVAEYCERPLYMVSSGDLGTQSSTLDDRLSKILDLASTWKAVLLIDEADVFLERRSLHDMERNSLVSIFLRVLEYYKGILFLTSNRVNTFDDAFKSRIHVPLKYNDLTTESRKQIWKNFLSNISGGVNIEPDDYDRLAEANLNGRQIKNIIRTAKSLGQFHGQKLDAAKLEQVVAIQREFEEELESSNAVNGVNGVMMNGH